MYAVSFLNRKHLTLFFLSLLLLLTTAACAAFSPQEQVLYVQVTNECDGEIYGLHFEYALGNTPIGGGYSINPDESAIQKGDILTLDFREGNFPAAPDLSLFEIEFYVVDENGNELPAGASLRFPVSYENTYHITLTGNAGSGFSTEYVK